jgi:hypothetical protein
MEFGHRVWKFYSPGMLEEEGMIDIATILKLLDEGIKIEKKIEEAIASETDKKRRKKLEKAFKDKGLSVAERRALIADILFDN